MKTDGTVWMHSLIGSLLPQYAPPMPLRDIFKWHGIYPDKKLIANKTVNIFSYLSTKKNKQKKTCGYSLEAPHLRNTHNICFCVEIKIYQMS